MNEVTVNGHANHKDEACLRVAGRWSDVQGLTRDAATIEAFLRENVPSGTIDRLTVILMRDLSDRLEGAGIVDLRSARASDFVRYCEQQVGLLND